MSLSGTVQPHVCKPFLLHPMSASHFYCVPFFEIHFNFSHLRQSIRQNVSPCICLSFLSQLQLRPLKSIASLHSIC